MSEVKKLASKYSKLKQRYRKLQQEFGMVLEQWELATKHVGKLSTERKFYKQKLDQFVKLQVEQKSQQPVQTANPVVNKIVQPAPQLTSITPQSTASILTQALHNGLQKAINVPNATAPSLAQYQPYQRIAPLPIQQQNTAPQQQMNFSSLPGQLNQQKVDQQPRATLNHIPMHPNPKAAIPPQNNSNQIHKSPYGLPTSSTTININ